MTDRLYTRDGEELRIVYVDGRPLRIPPTSEPEECGLCGRVDAFLKWIPPPRLMGVLRPVAVCSEKCKGRLLRLVNLTEEGLRTVFTEEDDARG